MSKRKLAAVITSSIIVIAIIVGAAGILVHHRNQRQLQQQAAAQGRSEIAAIDGWNGKVRMWNDQSSSAAKGNTGTAQPTANPSQTTNPSKTGNPTQTATPTVNTKLSQPQTKTTAMNGMTALTNTGPGSAATMAVLFVIVSGFGYTLALQRQRR